jgi:hypothetical protein
MWKHHSNMLETISPDVHLDLFPSSKLQAQQDASTGLNESTLSSLNHVAQECIVVGPLLLLLLEQMHMEAGWATCGSTASYKMQSMIERMKLRFVTHFQNK